MRVPVELEKCFRLLNHGPTVLVSSAHGENKNVMAAAWSMPLDYAPPKVTVVIEKSTFTRELVDASGTFALNVPCRPQAELTLTVGNLSGRDTLQKSRKNKLDALGISFFQGSKIDSPLIEGCVGWLECRVIPEPHIQEAYDLFIGEVVAAWADDRAFKNGRWLKTSPELHTLHYISGGFFFLASDVIEARPRAIL